jgi:uncharacterized protein YjbJ (UPF0337 family)
MCRLVRVLATSRGDRVKISFLPKFEWDFREISRRNAMSWDQIEGNWKQIKGKIRERWGKLTDDDLTEIAGKRDQLAGRLQERYGYEKERLEREIDDFARELKR